jgi:hypothetical protein
MVEGFEDYTYELTSKEMVLLPFVEKGLLKRSKNNPITGAELIKSMNAWIKEKNDEIILKNSSIVNGDKPKDLLSKINEPRLLKIIQYLRASGKLPVIAVGGNGKGYYVSYDEEDIKTQIRSLEQRARGVLCGAEGLRSMKAKGSCNQENLF